MNDWNFSSDKKNEQFCTILKEWFHLVNTNLITIQYICCLIVIISDIILFISIFRNYLRRQPNLLNQNYIVFVIGIIVLSFSYLLVILLAILELVYFEMFSKEFVFQFYFTAVFIPHALNWMNMQNLQ
jgi:hypothetical protein